MPISILFFKDTIYLNLMLLQSLFLVLMCDHCFHGPPTNLTRMLEVDSPSRQWAAVTTHRGSTKVPPQNWKPEGVLICACHGQAPLGAAVPPTIRVLGLYPQFPGSLENYLSQCYKRYGYFNRFLKYYNYHVRGLPREQRAARAASLRTSWCDGENNAAFSVTSLYCEYHDIANN